MKLNHKVNQLKSSVSLTLSLLLISSAFLLLDLVDLVPSFSATRAFAYSITFVLFTAALYFGEKAYVKRNNVKR